MNTRKFTVIKILSITILSLILIVSCSTMNGYDYDKIRESSSTQQKIVEAALNSCNIGYGKSLTFNGKQFNNDCSGLIYGIFWASGIDLQKEIATESGNGVKRIYKVLRKKGLIHRNRLPNPGDIIFWNNTYGVMGSKPLSHIGIVVSVDNKGNIEFVHNNTYLGAIKKESMNLYRPHEKMPVNHYMRYDKVYKKTAAELFDSFGMAWKL